MDRRKNGVLRLPCVSQVSKICPTCKDLDLLGNTEHAVRVPECESAHNSRAPIMSNRNLVIAELLGFIAGGWRERGMCNTYHFRDVNDV